MIREAKLEELETIYKLFLTNIEHFNFIKKMFMRQDNPFSKIVIYEEKEVILGAIFYSIMYERAEIDQIAVLKKARKKGIGHKLMNYFLEQASECNEISLEVDRKNKNAIKLYQDYGFKNVAVRKNYYPSGDAILMVKEVK